MGKTILFIYKKEFNEKSVRFLVLKMIYLYL